MIKNCWNLKRERRSVAKKRAVAVRNDRVCLFQLCANGLQVLKGTFKLLRTLSVYAGAPDTLVLEDRGRAERFSITQTTSHPNTVIFNPWIEGKKGDKGPDYDDDGEWVAKV
eukprot:3041668-Amphidinium_carterae.1